MFTKLDNIRENKSMTYSFVTIIVGVSWFILARAAISYVNPTAPPHPNWQPFGDPIHDLPGVLLNIVGNPLETLRVIISPVGQKTLYIFGLFEPLAFLSFLSPPSLMIGLPWFAIAFLSNYAPYYSPVGYQYTAFVAPFVFISAVYGAKRFWTIRDHLSRNIRMNRIGALTAVTRFKKVILVSFLFLVIAISYVTAIGIRTSIPNVTEHDKIAEAFIKLIPSDASVLTQNDLFPHISRRLYVYALAGISDRLPSDVTYDYVFVDTTSPWYVESLKTLVSNLTTKGSFGIQFASQGLLLLKKGYVGPTIDPVQSKIISPEVSRRLAVRPSDVISKTMEK
jgi:uncharacterized membrane protein